MKDFLITIKEFVETIIVVVSFILFIAFILLSIVMLIMLCVSLAKSNIHDAKLYVINFLISLIVSGVFGGIGLHLTNN